MTHARRTSPSAHSRWSRIGVRVTAVVALAGGVLGGLHLGELDRSDQEPPVSTPTSAVEPLELQLRQTPLSQWLRGDVRQRELEAQAKLRAAVEARTAASRAKAAEQEASRRSAELSSVERPIDFGPIPSSCGSYTGNRAIGCALLLEAGFGLDQMPCLDKLWTKESGWNHKARNRSSGAYGIPQALPGSKMGSVAADWETNPATQIKWGLGYIKGRYGSPCNAWQHSLSTGWY